MIPVRALISPNRPWIHLLYLGMFFFGWLYQPPGPTQAVLSLVAMAGFVAVYVFAMRRMDWTIYPAALAAAILGLVMMPHALGGGVYLVFAAAMLGRLDFTPRLWLALAALAVSGVTGAWLFAPTLLVIPALLGLGAMAAAGSAFAARNERQASEADSVRARAAHEAAEAERQRIARDLHDLLGHTLSVVTLKAEIAERLLDRDPGRARTELQAIQSISREALAEVREAVIGLRGRTLADALGDARQRLMDAGLEVEVGGTTGIDGLSGAVSTALAMTVREAVTNVLRHAGASTVRLDMALAADTVTLAVADDGAGGADPTGGGLTGLAARLADLGGALHVGSGPDGRGTRITARLPLAGD